MRSGITTGLFLLAFLVQLRAQDLQRRAFMGIRMEPVTEDVQRVMKLPAIKGVLIQQIIAGSTAEAAGLQRGDVLLELDGREVNSPDEAVRAVGAYRAGQTLQYKLFRAGKTMVQQTIIQGVPAETYPDLEVTYSSVKAGDAQLRTMLTRPRHRSGKLPALLFIQGIGCYSMDTPFDTLRPETQLINAIARQGFVVMRVDKSGLGDSRGAPCESIDFYTELEGYRQAYAALQASAGVDSSNCFVFGHSMGGLMAPMLAKDFSVKGIVAYGTIGVNFMEYFTNTRRTIAQALELDAAETDTYVKRECACAAMLLSARLSREEAVKLDEVCDGVYDILLLRSEAYWRQLYDLNIPALWQAYQGKALAAWGSTDYISARREHELIAETVNQSHPGNGTFLEIPNSNHGMYLASTFSEARTNPGPFNPKVTEMVSEWLKKQLIWKMPENMLPEKENVQEVLWMEGIENAYPRLSQDGSKILFQSNRSGKWQLYLMDTDGSNVRQLTQGDHNNNFPDWSADNRKIAFVSDRDGNEEIYIMDRDGSNLIRLTNHPGRDIHPYFAPDGKSLLFNSSRDNRESFEIYQTDLKAKNQTRITQTPEVETCARFSPDGKKILYLKGFPDGSDDIFVMNSDGSNPVNLTQTPQMEGWPAWSPDGSKIIFSSRRNGAYRLYEMNADGSDVRQVSFAEPPKYDARAGYAASGNQIVFNRQMDRTIGIYLLKRFTNNPTNHD
ncbi:MAG: alpha/beta fold hydrolase [Saprospiraceae bacterium]|nr:alpha/beta fold hydrolase [Saprospiraceae bacterium]